MRKLIVLLVGVLILGTLDICWAQKQPKQSSNDVIVLAKEFIERLAEGHFSKATEHFDATMKTVVPPEQLRQIWNSLIAKYGVFEKQLGTQTKTILFYNAVFVTCQFEKALVDLQVTFDSANQIAGFHIAATRPKAEYKSPRYVKPDRFEEREVHLGSGEWVLPGTLSIPKGAGPFAAVVLVHGSGPHDRDETIGANKPFRDIAQGLASKGIAAVRYEKRTKQYASKIAMLKDLTVKEEAIDDALAAVELLRKIKKINRRKIFVLGHSLGAALTPRIRKADSKIAGLIMLAGPARPVEDVILEQFTYIFLLDGTISQAEKPHLEKLKKQVAKVKEPHLSVDTPAAQLPLNVPASYWLDLRSYKPADFARNVPVPMLILQGSRDYCVTLADFEIWKKVLGSRKDVKFKLYPKLDHLFIAGEGKSSPAEMQRPGNVAEFVIGDIAEWIRRTTEDGRRKTDDGRRK